jgi:hypothetical protein
MGQTGNVLKALLQGFTGAGLFRRLDYPGAPTKFFDDHPLEEALYREVLRSDSVRNTVLFKSDEEYESTMLKLRKSIDRVRKDARESRTRAASSAHASR